jgi:hypothetical protein
MLVDKGLSGRNMRPVKEVKKKISEPVTAIKRKLISQK